MCVCSELRNQIPKMQYLIILHFKTAQITVNFFLWITWLKFYLKFTGSHAFYLLHYRKQTLLQTSHHVLKPLAPLVPRQTAQLSPQTDGATWRGLWGFFPEEKWCGCWRPGTWTRVQDLSVYVRVCVRLRSSWDTCVCVWSTACWRPFNITCTDL